MEIGFLCIYPEPLYLNDRHQIEIGYHIFSEAVLVNQWKSETSLRFSHES